MKKEILIIIGVIAIFIAGIGLGAYLNPDAFIQDNTADSGNSSLANATNSSLTHKNPTENKTSATQEDVSDNNNNDDSSQEYSNYNSYSESDSSNDNGKDNNNEEQEFEYDPDRYDSYSDQHSADYYNYAGDSENERPL